MPGPLENFQFTWPLFNVVMEGASVLDVPRLEIHTMEEATNFMQAYGFDPGNAEDLEIVWRSFEEAIRFLEVSLGDPEFPKVPDHLRTRDAIRDPRRLLILASERARGPDQVLSCAILRLMHLIVHVDHDPRLQFFDQVQAQVLGRLENYLYNDTEKGITYLGRPEEPGAVKLLFFKKKDHKDRERELIKLLHKKENAVEDIYDRIGFRLVTETKWDAVRAVRLLVEKNIISIPNVKPGRSRNRLVDFARLQFEVDRIQAHIEKNGGSTPYIEKLIRRLESRIGFSSLGRSLLNPHTSDYYHAIQYTCRELVRVKNPLHQVYIKLKESMGSGTESERVTSKVFPARVPEYLRVFFPYEIQIMDVKSYADSIFGKSSHEDYRNKQLESARQRVFGRRK